MSTATLAELRLGAFKSFRGAVLPLRGTTILTGRNSSGKSNALDALEVLARLATGDDLRDALDGRQRDGGPIRGGSRGCPPHGEGAFELGCTVELDGDCFTYQVTIAVQPELRVIAESLEGPCAAAASDGVSHGSIFQSQAADRHAPGIGVKIHNGRRGRNEVTLLRDDRLLLAQVPLAVTGKNRAEKSVLRGVHAVAGALRGVFHLDPEPHLMREFVPARDSELRRTGQNLAAALLALKETAPERFDEVVQLIRGISDHGVESIGFVRSELDDVMLTLLESRGVPPTRERTAARKMSDGMLRFAAIATALLSASSSLDLEEDVPTGPSGGRGELVSGGVLVVIEELENGLHPSQARRVLDLVRESSTERGTGVLVTTHSPALLDAAEGSLNQSIMVCYRDPVTGYSTLTPLVDLPDYAAALAQKSLGGAVATGRLSDGAATDRDSREFERLLGIG